MQAKYHFLYACLCLIVCQCNSENNSDQKFIFLIEILEVITCWQHRTYDLEL